MSDSSTSTAAATAVDSPNGADEKTCFVVIGFGKKTDYATGRVLDLDLTYTKLIKPAFDAAGVRCFRAIDVNVSGSIDILMYQWIYRADFVVADLSTMNANVFYELGVRYAQKPSTTLIMAENDLFKKLPFDLSHTIIYGYEHLGEAIADAEVERFVPLLTEQIRKLVAEPPLFDSPVYTYLQGMKAPEWTDATELIAELEARLAERDELASAAESDGPIDPDVIREKALSTVIDTAEAAKNRKDYDTAIALYRAAIDNARQAARAATPDTDPDADGKVGGPSVKIDVSLWQRLALVTYKRVEDYDRDDPDENQAAIEALDEAMQILMDECDALVSTDPETLGLSGAINKRLYDRTDERRYFRRSVGYYERGFYIKQDYYNGINAAFMYTIESVRLAEAGETFDAIVHFGHANMIRRTVAEICQRLIADTTTFERLGGDREWVYLTLWEAHFGMGETEAAEALEPMIEQLATDFGRDSWSTQREKLESAIARFEQLVDVESAAPTAATAPAVSTASPAASAAVALREPISVDLGELRDRTIRSVEVKVEFDD